MPMRSCCLLAPRRAPPQVYTLRRTALRELVEQHQVARHCVRRAVVRLTMQRALLCHLKRVTNLPTPKSFISKSSCHEPDMVDETFDVDRTVESRLDTAAEKMVDHSGEMTRRHDKLAAELAEVKQMLQAVLTRLPASSADGASLWQPSQQI